MMKLTLQYSRNFGRPTDKNKFYRGMGRSLKQVGKDLATTARAGIAQPPKSGRIYIVNGKAHRASAPYEYPANRSGRLRRSTTSTTKGLSMEFGTKRVSYAPMLQQFKTAQQRKSNWSRLAPRPYLTLAHDTVIKQISVRSMVSSIQAELGI